MLEKIDLDQVFAAVRREGYLSAEVFAETRIQTRFALLGRVDDTRIATTGGLSLRCFDGRSTRHFTTTSPTTAALLRALKSETSLTTDTGEPFVAASLPTRLPLADRISILTGLARHAFGSESVRMPSLDYDETMRYFEVAHSPDKVSSGLEESVELAAHWVVDRNGSQRAFNSSRYSASIDRLFLDLAQGNPITAEVERSLAASDPWPAPSGEIPILWSARALSKLQLQFLRAFEGDLVLGNLSFLTDLALPLDLPFTIEEKPDLDRLACDNEGSPRRPMPIFHGGRPKALACNNWIAEQLAVPSTGHCRRNSFLSAPTVAFWAPRVQGVQHAERLAEKMPWGLSVRDIEVLRFDPFTADLTLRLKDTYLLHQGEEGEPIENVELKLPLLRILQSLRYFEPGLSITGLPVSKHQQKLITEVAAPVAISDPLPIPGTVPINNYW